MDLPTGHVHAHHYARSEPPPQYHRPVKRKVRSNANSASASGRERGPIPQMPHWRAQQQESQEIPLSESSLPSSPRSGPRKARPYGLVEDAVEGSSFEFVPSLATQAPCASGIDESFDVTPIPRSKSSQISSKTIQVMNPNLAAGSASSATHPQRHDEPAFDPSMARAMLQQWAESKLEMGVCKGLSHRSPRQGHWQTM